MNVNILQRIEKRIKHLIKLSIEDKIDEKNVKMSKKKLESFLKNINLYKYPSAIGLDDDGYFSLEIKKYNKKIFIIFRKMTYFYLCEKGEIIMSLKLKNFKDFFKIVNLTTYDKFFYKN